MLLQRQGHVAEAERYLREALEGRRRELGDEKTSTLINASNLAILLLERDEPEEAESMMRDTVEVARRTLGAEHWLVGNFLSKHGRALAVLGRYDGAEAVLLESHAILEAAHAGHTVLMNQRDQITRAVDNLVDLYDTWGKPQEAAEWRAKLHTEQEAVASDQPAPSNDDDQDEPSPGR